ncbi:MAG: 2,3-bisphosphoglycerate-independent phosphoglycerate mutase [Coriobacteriales bacterium]|jgi:2,3-bisphosphoglycerate-independent phosphoglycerate mutase|nr:2,3-bisphosphoglycerate-independent phosphoglycerate mutase [Coriobacteriales bacterium]
MSTAAHDNTAPRTPALLAILDGVGLCEETTGNAFRQARAPLLHALFAEDNPAFCSLGASGSDVGLPEGQMGNSEVGHLTIGAGRVVNQELTRINVAIEDGTLFKNRVLLDVIDAVVEGKATLHLLGLLSKGGVHSTLEHLEALLALAVHRGVKRVRIHAILDGRDVAPESGADYVRELDLFIEGLVLEHLGLDMRIGTISGRYYAMDRDKRWDRIEAAWRAMVLPFEPDVATVLASDDAAELVLASYAEGVSDEFIKPIAVGDDAIIDGDSLIFFNFRPDRARELTRAFIDPEFESYAFARPLTPRVRFVCMTEYDPAFEQRFGAGVVFAKEFPANTLADYFASLGLRQLHIAETEKYAHVTFFFNGGSEEPKPGEERILIPSPRVATYDLQPEMSAPEVSRALAEAIREDRADVYIVNFANGDMVGHTGNREAAVKAIETVDACLGEVLEALKARQGLALITADHGNAERMQDAEGNPWTAHTLSRVPLALVDTARGMTPEAALSVERRADARLADIAPTLLDLMGLPIPREFTGRSLLLEP